MLSLTLSGRMLFVHLGEQRKHRQGGQLFGRDCKYQTCSDQTCATSRRARPQPRSSLTSTTLIAELWHIITCVSNESHGNRLSWGYQYWGENFNRWTFAVNTGWLMTALLVLQCWFLKRLIASIRPFILQSDFTGKTAPSVDCKVWRGLHRLPRVSLDHTELNGETNLIYVGVTSNLRGFISSGQVVALTSSYK